jgi:hypothetical protein
MPGEVVKLDQQTPAVGRASNALRPVGPEVAALVAPTSSTSKFSEDGSFLGLREQWTAPASVPARVLPDLHHQAALLEAVLLPADRGHLLARILALLSHYRERDPLPPAVEQAIAEDWADDLGEYPAWAVEEACRAWRRDPKRYRFKPLPNDIRLICEEIIEPQAVLKRRVRKLIQLVTPGIETARHGQSRGAEATTLKERIAAVAAARKV